jgi:hypothetical protein
VLKQGVWYEIPGQPHYKTPQEKGKKAEREGMAQGIGVYFFVKRKMIY